MQLRKWTSLVIILLYMILGFRSSIWLPDQVSAATLPTVSLSVNGIGNNQALFASTIFYNQSNFQPTNNRWFDFRVKGATGWSYLGYQDITANTFSAAIYVLEQNKTYQVRAVVDCTGVSEHAYSPIVEFTTLNLSAPVISAPTVSNLRADSVTVSCNITSGGNATITLRRIYVGTMARQDTVNAIGQYSFDFKDLLPNTTYQVLGEVTNTFNLGRSPIISITTPNGYKINYYPNGGTNPINAPKYYTVGYSLTLPIPTRTGYEFAGWYNNSNFFGSPITTISATATGDRTYYAKWAVRYTITYNLNGGINPSNAPASYRDDMTGMLLLPTPSRSGYQFGGWFDNSQLSGTPISAIYPGSTGNKVYYAKWTLAVTPTSTPKPTVTPTPTVKPTPTLMPTAKPTPTLTPTAMPTPTLTPTAIPTPTLTPTAKPTPTLTPTAMPIATPTATATTTTQAPTSAVSPTAAPSPASTTTTTDTTASTTETKPVASVTPVATPTVSPASTTTTVSSPSQTTAATTAEKPEPTQPAESGEPPTGPTSNNTTWLWLAGGAVLVIAAGIIIRFLRRPS